MNLLLSSKNLDKFTHSLALGVVLSLPFSTTLTQAFALVSILFACCLESYQKNLWAVCKQKAVIVVVSFYALFILGSFYSVAPISDIFLILKKMSKLLLFPLLQPFFIEERWRNRAILGFLAVISFVVLCGLWFKAGTVFKDTISTSVLMAFGGFMLLHYYFRSQSQVKKFLYGLGFAIFCLYAVLYSAGRMSFIVFMILCLLASFQTGGVKRLLKMTMLLCCLLLVAFFWGSDIQKKRFVRAYNEYKMYDEKIVSKPMLHASSVGTRLSFLHNSTQLFFKEPIWGFGTGSFKTVYAEQVRSKNLKTTHNPHNQYLHVLVQLGLIGLFSLIWMFVILWRETTFLNNFERYLTQGVLVLVIIGSFANSWLLDFLPGYLFVSILAICFAAYHPPGKKV